jgi:hypothetical protein
MRCRGVPLAALPAGWAASASRKPSASMRQLCAMSDVENIHGAPALVTASADRIAQRIERGTVSSGERTNAANGSSVLANRLDALRPQNLRADGTRAASMGQIR